MLLQTVKSCSVLLRTLQGGREGRERGNRNEKHQEMKEGGKERRITENNYPISFTVIEKSWSVNHKKKH